METYDTIRYIGYHISDPQALIDYCTLNNAIMNVCSDRSFWEPIFEKYNLPLDDVFYTNVNQWIKLFVKSLDAMNKTIKYINIAYEESMIEDIVGQAFKLKKISDISLLQNKGMEIFGWSTEESQYYLDPLNHFRGFSINLYMDTHNFYMVFYYNQYEIHYKVQKNLIQNFLFYAIFNDLIILTDTDFD